MKDTFREINATCSGKAGKSHGCQFWKKPNPSMFTLKFYSINPIFMDYRPTSYEYKGSLNR